MTWIVPIISNVVVAGLIALLAWLAGRSGRRAALAHLLWIAFFVKVVTPPLVLFPISVPSHWFDSLTLEQPDSAPPFSSSSPQTDADTVLSPDSVEFSSPGAQESNSGVLSWLNPSILLLVVWAGGGVYCLTRSVLRFLRFRSLIQREGLHDEEADRFVASLIDAYSPRKQSPRTTPSVLRIPLRISPMLFGFGRSSVIVCPEILWTSLAEEERQAVLAHETAHYCRRDHWVRWMECLVTSIYWWYPLVYVARHQMERHEEACCDEWAVRILNSSPRQYADSLLKVVDFISEHHIRVPHLASAMRPTSSLEMRLRLIMQIGKHPANTRRSGIGFVIACVLLLLLHPFPRPMGSAVQAGFGVSSHEQDSSRDSAHGPASLEHSAIETRDLPPTPQGFWNQWPEPQWADVSLSLSGVKLQADVTSGITIVPLQGDSLRFSADELRAIVEIPRSRRVVIGTRDGSVRVWDLDAGTPISLLGRHAQEVTSLAYHIEGGLISSDAGGSVMRWDMQSGQVLATSTFSAPGVQSIRFSADGRSIAVLTGRWDAAPEMQRVYILKNSTLQATRELRLNHRAALVVAVAGDRWVSVDWTGTVRDLESEAEIGRIPKPRVSAMLLSQIVALPEILNDSDN